MKFGGAGSELWCSKGNLDTALSSFPNVSVSFVCHVQAFLVFQLQLHEQMYNLSEISLSEKRFLLYDEKFVRQKGSTFSEYQKLKFSKFPIPTCFITSPGSKISKRSLEVLGCNTITQINFSHILSLTRVIIMSIVDLN